MKILALDIFLQTASLEIYFSGCNGKMIDGKLQHCPGCHNPESWNFDSGKDYNEFLKSLDLQIRSFPLSIKNIWLLGGDPLDQDIDKLKEFINKIKKYNLPIMIFTGHSMEEAKEIFPDAFDYVKWMKVGYYDSNLESIHVLVDGVGTVELGSENQQIIESY